MKKKEKKSNSDPFKGIKHLAYCTMQPPAKMEKPDLEDFIRYARYRICVDKKVLFWDPVWDTYTDEQILIEYYTLVFENSTDQLEEFEASIKGLPENDIEWIEEQIRKNQEDLDSLKDGFNVTPNTLGG